MYATLFKPLAIIIYAKPIDDRFIFLKAAIMCNVRAKSCVGGIIIQILLSRLIFRKRNTLNG